MVGEALGTTWGKNGEQMVSQLRKMVKTDLMIFGILGGLGTWPGGATASTLAETEMDEGWVMLGTSWYIRKSSDVV